MTCDRWQVTCDMWHVTCCGGWTFSQNFSSLDLSVRDLWYYEDLEEKAHWLNQWMKDKAVYRTAQATPGLLMTAMDVSDPSRIEVVRILAGTISDMLWISDSSSISGQFANRIRRTFRLTEIDSNVANLMLEINFYQSSGNQIFTRMGSHRIPPPPPTQLVLSKVHIPDH